MFRGYVAFQALRVCIFNMHPDAWKDQHEETSEISPNGWDSTAKSGVQVVFFFNSVLLFLPEWRPKCLLWGQTLGVRGWKICPHGFLIFFVVYTVYPSSHNHGSVENGCISNSSCVFRYFSTCMIMGEKGRVVVALCSVLGDVFLSSHWVFWSCLVRMKRSRRYLEESARCIWVSKLTLATSCNPLFR